MKTALVTGATGQIGSYLCDLLLDKGYKVYALKRRSSSNDLGHVQHLVSYTNFEVVEGDLLDLASLQRIIQLTKPHEIYNCAAQSVAPDTIVYIRTAGEILCKPIANLWKELAKKNKITIETDSQGLKIEVINLKETSTTNILAFQSGLGTFRPLRQISRHKYTGPLVTLRQKWGEVTLTPNHSAIDKYGQTFNPRENKECLAIRNINWDRSRTLRNLKAFNGNIPKEKESIFLKFLGFFIAEGWTSFNKTNRSYISGICNQNKEILLDFKPWLEEWTKHSWSLVEGKKKGFKSVWQLTCSSKELYKFLRKLVGTSSSSKQLPKWFARLNNNQLEILLQGLVLGDGCYKQWKSYLGIRYTTKSQILISQLGFLMSLLKRDYSIQIEDTESGKQYHLRECKSYQDTQGTQNIYETNFDGYVYDLSVPGPTNFAAGPGTIVVHNSHVGISFKEPVHTAQATGIGVLNLLEAIRLSGVYSKLLQFSTSEMFGGSASSINESSVFHPRSPYASAKVFAHHSICNYRESYNMFAACAICFNNSSPRRGEQFATRKITKSVAEVKLGLRSSFDMGNLDASRDESHTKDIARGAYLILQQSDPEDFVLGSGTTTTIRDMLTYVCKIAELDPEKIVRINPSLYRPAEVHCLLADSSKARSKLGWTPKYTWQETLREMYENDLKLLQNSH